MVHSIIMVQVPEEEVREMREAWENRDKVFHGVRIGKFHLSTCPHGGIWIESEKGEGGQFKNVEALEAVIEAFYKENF